MITPTPQTVSRVASLHLEDQTYCLTQYGICTRFDMHPTTVHRMLKDYTGRRQKIANMWIYPLDQQLLDLIVETRRRQSVSNHPNHVNGKARPQANA